MTTGKPPERRNAYITTSWLHVTTIAVSLHPAGFAVVDMGEFNMHVHDAGQARELAAAFTKAAELLETCPECRGLLPGHQLTCPRIPAGPEHDAGSDAIPAGGTA